MQNLIINFKNKYLNAVMDKEKKNIIMKLLHYTHTLNYELTSKLVKIIKK